MTSAIKIVLPCGGDGKESLISGWLWFPLWWEDDEVLFVLCRFASLSIAPFIVQSNWWICFSAALYSAIISYKLVPSVKDVYNILYITCLVYSLNKRIDVEGSHIISLFFNFIY